MKRMYSQEELENIIRALIPESTNSHVYSLSKSTGNSDAGSQTTVYFVADKDIDSASDLVADDIHNHVIGVNYHEWNNSTYSTLYVSLGNFGTKSNGQINFYRIKQTTETDTDVFGGISDSNISLATLKTYTLTKLV